MSQEIFDLKLECRIRRLETAVESWAQRNALWDNAKFDRVVRYFDMETGSPTVTVLRADGLLAELIIYPGMGAIHESREAQELADQCQKLMQEHGFLSIPFDGNRLYIMPDETSQPDVFEQFKKYKRWRWICGLIQGDFDALNAELYNYFGTKPERLERLHWREFEKLVAELLESQGFVVELGPGSADGGVDLRFLQRDPIGDVLTLVQVKKYRKDRKIRLDAVQALHGARMAERADGSMFITTSSYLPSAKKFAGRENVLMKPLVHDDPVTPDVALEGLTE